MVRAAHTTEVKRLQELAAAGMTAPAIAREIKRTPNTVRNWCRKYSVPLKSEKYPGPPYTPLEAQRLFELADMGYSTTAIAAHLNRTPLSIRQKAAALGISLRPPKQTNEIRFGIERELLVVLKEAAVAHGYVTPSRLVRHLVGLIVFDGLFVALLGDPPQRAA